MQDLKTAEDMDKQNQKYQLKHLSLEIKTKNPKVWRIFHYGKPNNKAVIEVITIYEGNKLHREPFEYDTNGGLSTQLAAMAVALQDADKYIDDLKGDIL